MLEFFMNPWILLMIVSPIMLLFGIIGGNLLSQPRKNRVLKIAPESHQGVELEIKEEDSTSIYCNPVGKMPPQKFIKRLSAFNIVRKGWMKIQNYALWIGRYGTAYVHKFETPDVKVSLKDALFTLFGKKYYKQIPSAIKQTIESGKMGVIVEFPKTPLTPKDQNGKPLPSLSEDDIQRANDGKAMSNLWDAFDKERTKSHLEKVAYIGTGIAIGFVIMLITKWGAPVIIPPVTLPPVGG